MLATCLTCPSFWPHEEGEIEFGALSPICSGKARPLGMMSLAILIPGTGKSGPFRAQQRLSWKATVLGPAGEQADDGSSNDAAIQSTKLTLYQWEMLR